jgi:hypothetical protein
MRKADYKIARELLQKLSENNSDAELRQRARTMLAQLVTMEEQLANSGEDPRNRPILRDSDNSGAQPKGRKNVDPSVYLREALRKPEAGETQVQGLLMRIDCDAKGITFVVKVGEGMLKLTTTSFEDFDLTSFSPDGGTEIKCGPREPENNVIVAYVPAGTGGKTDGIAKSMEFVPKDFKLKTEP